MTSYERQKPLWGSEEAETASGWNIRKSCIQGRNSIWNGLRGKAGVLLRAEGKQEICSRENKVGNCKGREDPGCVGTRKDPSPKGV